GQGVRFGGEASDCFFLEAATLAQAADLVVELVADRLPRRYGYRKGEVQVLASMHCGEAGGGMVNARLQDALNPAREGMLEARSGGRVFRVGDRLLQLRNDYDLKVFNGGPGDRDRDRCERAGAGHRPGRWAGDRLPLRRALRAHP